MAVITMARPLKIGLEYFPHDTNASTDPKLEPLIILYGSKGYAFYFLHLEYIYKEDGFELNVSDAETRQIFIRKLAITNEEYEQILKTALKHGLFDKELFDGKGCLSSKSINERATKILDKRVRMRSIYEAKQYVPDAETTQETAQETTAETLQTKLNKTKLNKTKLNNIIELYNSMCISLPKILKTNNTRTTKGNIRLKEMPELAQWELLFKKIEASDFLTGRSERQNGHEKWICDFDWIIKNDMNITKILEGKYDNSSSFKGKKIPPQRALRNAKDVVDNDQ